MNRGGHGGKSYQLRDQETKSRAEVITEGGKRRRQNAGGIRRGMWGWYTRNKLLGTRTSESVTANWNLESAAKEQRAALKRGSSKRKQTSSKSAGRRQGKSRMRQYLFDRGRKCNSKNGGKKRWEREGQGKKM